MAKYTLGNYPSANPYSVLALNVFLEAFRDIWCYFTNKGTEDEICEGRRAIRWMIRMQGNYKILAGASGKPLEWFHQKCISRINELKREAYEATTMAQENTQSTIRGETNSPLDTQEL